MYLFFLVRFSNEIRKHRQIFVKIAYTKFNQNL